jgi:hypothetical protein
MYILFLPRVGLYIMTFAPADFIFGAVAVFERHPFCHRHLLYRSGSVSTVNFLHCFLIINKLMTQSDKLI